MNSSVELRPIVPPTDKNRVLLVVTYQVSPFVAPDNSKLESELVLPFTIRDANDITIADLYTCILMTRDMMQSIFDKIFLNELRNIIPVIEFDLLKEKLVSHLEDIQKKL